MCAQPITKVSRRTQSRNTANIFYLFFFRNILCVFTFFCICLDLFTFFLFLSEYFYIGYLLHFFYIFDIFCIFLHFDIFFFFFFFIFSFFHYISHLRSVCIFNCVGCMILFVTVSPTINGPTRKSDSSLI